VVPKRETNASGMAEPFVPASRNIGWQTPHRRPHTLPAKGGNVPLWIPITVAAALFQNIRTTMQQKIRGVLSVDGANFVRYLYSAPLTLGMLAFLVLGTGRHVPSLSPGFFAWVTIAGLAQIVATSLMIHAFSLRNYAVGTVYSKTETVFVALFATAGIRLRSRLSHQTPLA
jgi:hypothetical protein